MRPRMSVHTSLTSVVEQTMSRQFPGCAQSPFLQRGWTRLAHSGGMGVVRVTRSHRRRLTSRVERWYASASSPLTPGGFGRVGVLGC